VALHYFQTWMAIPLPSELLAHVLAYVNDSPTLRSTSLVARTWANASQRLLFRRINIHQYYRWTNFVALLQSSSHLRPFVRSLLMATYAFVDGRDGLDVLLPQLEEVTFRGVIPIFELLVVVTTIKSVTFISLPEPFSLRAIPWGKPQLELVKFDASLAHDSPAVVLEWLNITRTSSSNSLRFLSLRIGGLDDIMVITAALGAHMLLDSLELFVQPSHTSFEPDECHCKHGSLEVLMC
jgi:hypothetical protein